MYFSSTAGERRTYEPAHKIPKQEHLSGLIIPATAYWITVLLHELLHFRGRRLHWPPPVCCTPRGRMSSAILDHTYTIENGSKKYNCVINTSSILLCSSYFSTTRY